MLYASPYHAYTQQGLHTALFFYGSQVYPAQCPLLGLWTSSSAAHSTIRMVVCRQLSVISRQTREKITLQTSPSFSSAIPSVFSYT